MTETASGESPPKLCKLDNNESVSSHLFKSFDGFKVKRILKENPESRLIVVEGSFSRDTSAESDSPTSVVVLEKTHFTEDEVNSVLTKSTTVACLFNNDIYYNLLCHPPIHLNGIKATVIHPATEKHIEKYSSRKSFLIEETSLIYCSVTLPHINESKFDLQVSDALFPYFKKRMKMDKCG